MGPMIDPKDVAEAARASSTAADHGAVFFGLVPALSVAAFIGTLLAIKDVLQVKTWKGKLIVYLTMLTSGLGGGYAAMLALPLSGLDNSPQMQQLAGIAGFVVGKDVLGFISRQAFGLRTRQTDQEARGGEVPGGDSR